MSMKITSLVTGTVFLLYACLSLSCNQQPKQVNGPRNPAEVNTRSEPINRNEHHLIYTKHARCRMDCRHISEKEIFEILERGEINYRKSEPSGRPDPKYALDGRTEEGQHLRVVFATALRGLVVVTCIDLDNEFQCDCN